MPLTKKSSSKLSEASRISMESGHESVTSADEKIIDNNSLAAGLATLSPSRLVKESSMSSVPSLSVTSSPPSPSRRTRVFATHDGLASGVETTSVTFSVIPETELNLYCATAESMDKAGAYGIQGYAARWIPRINGDYFNVMGLPIARVVRLIESVVRQD